jgi:hypothetical protein
MKTKDLGLCCLLQASRCEMLGHELDTRGQVWIDWRDTDVTRNLEREFFNGTVTINLADYLSAQKQLKTLIFDLRRIAYGDGEYLLHRKQPTM